MINMDGLHVQIIRGMDDGPGPFNLLDLGLRKFSRALQNRRPDQPRHNFMDLDHNLLEREELVVVTLDLTVNFANRPFRPINGEGLVAVEVRERFDRSR